MISLDLAELMALQGGNWSVEQVHVCSWIAFFGYYELYGEGELYFVYYQVL